MCLIYWDSMSLQASLTNSFIGQEYLLHFFPVSFYYNWSSFEVGQAHLKIGQIITDDPTTIVICLHSSFHLKRPRELCLIIPFVYNLIHIH